MKDGESRVYYICTIQKVAKKRKKPWGWQFDVCSRLYYDGNTIGWFENVKLFTDIDEARRECSAFNNSLREDEYGFKCYVVHGWGVFVFT